MGLFYEVEKFEISEEEFQQCLELANNDKPTEGAREKLEWAKAIEKVALTYLNGAIGEINYEKGFQYLKKSYDQGGYTHLKIYLAICYYWGFGVDKDEYKAKEVIEEARENVKGTTYEFWAQHIDIMIYSSIRSTEKSKIIDELYNIETELKRAKLEINDWESKYNELKSQFEEEKERSERRRVKYNELVEKYDQMASVSKAIAMSAVQSASSGSSSSSTSASSSSCGKVRVRISFYYSNGRSGLGNLFASASGNGSGRYSRTLSIPEDEYKALLRGSMKNRIAYVENHASKLEIGNGEVTDVSIELV